MSKALVLQCDLNNMLPLDKSKIKGGKTTKVVLTIVPSQLKGELLNATIRFVVNDPSNPQPVMRVVGELK